MPLVCASLGHLDIKRCWTGHACSLLRKHLPVSTDYPLVCGPYLNATRKSNKPHIKPSSLSLRSPTPTHSSYSTMCPVLQKGHARIQKCPPLVPAIIVRRIMEYIGKVPLQNKLVFCSSWLSLLELEAWSSTRCTIIEEASSSAMDSWCCRESSDGWRNGNEISGMFLNTYLLNQNLVWPTYFSSR